MTPLLLSLLLAAGPVQRLALPPLTGVRLSGDLVEFYGEHLAAALRHQGLTVVTSKEIATVLGLERQKELLGCADAGSSCIAELSGALGVDGTVSGSIARLDQSYQVHLKVLAAADARVLAEFRATAQSETELLERLDDAARAIAGSLRPPPPPRALRWYAWIPAAVGAAALAGSGLFYFDAKGAHDELVRPTGEFLVDGRVASLVSRGDRSQVLSGVALGAGLAALAVSGALFWLGAPAEAAPTVWLVPSPVGLSVAGRWP